jgi:O-antigen/teichoic acid export membrane protein
MSKLSLHNETTTINSKKGFLWQLSVLMTGSITGYLIYFLSLPLLSRVYTPEEFGIATSILILINLIGAIGSLRYDVAIVSAENNHDAIHLFLLSVLNSTLVSLAITLILFNTTLSTHLVTEILDFSIICLIAFNILCVSVYSASRYLNLRNQKYRVLSYSSILLNTTRVFTAISFAYFDYGWKGLFFAELISYLIASIYLSYHGVRIYPRKILKKFNIDTYKYILLKYQKNSIWLVPSTFINTASFAILVPFMVFFYGAEEGGGFSFAYRVMLAPISLISLTVGDVYHQQISSCKNKSQLKNKFYKTSLLLFIMGAGLIIILFYGEYLFALIFGEEWKNSGRLAALMTPWLWMQIISSPLSRTLIVLDQQEKKLFFDIALLVSVIISLLLGSCLSLSIDNMILNLSFFFMMCYMLYYITIFKSIRNFTFNGK